MHTSYSSFFLLSIKILQQSLFSVSRYKFSTFTSIFEDSSFNKQLHPTHISPFRRIQIPLLFLFSIVKAFPLRFEVTVHTQVPNDYSFPNGQCTGLSFFPLLESPGAQPRHKFMLRVQSPSLLPSAAITTLNSHSQINHTLLSHLPILPEFSLLLFLDDVQVTAETTGHKWQGDRVRYQGK